jgi:hypothetical protein
MVLFHTLYSFIGNCTFISRYINSIIRGYGIGSLEAGSRTNEIQLNFVNCSYGHADTDLVDRII